jgi:hypothetical protein
MKNNSSFLNNLGLGNVDIGYGILILFLLILLLLVMLSLQAVKTNRLKKRLDRFMLGKEGSSLEEDIAALYEDSQFLKNDMNKNRKEINILSRELENAYQKIGLVKYDAFRHVGGQLSFSLVLLNKNNDGFVLNSVHSSEGCYVYTKAIKGGKSAISLGEEEIEALRLAMKE